MKTKHILLSGALFAFILFGCKKDKDNDTEETMNDTDKNFMKMAATGNYNEVDAGTMASSKATDQSVKTFGQMMVTDHTTAQAELSTLAGNKEISLPSGPDQMHIDMKNQMMQMNGHKFDSAYIHSQVTDHQTVLNLFKDEQANGKDQDVKDYANKFIHHIQMHFDRADSTAKRF
jgi:putative membrane protein